MELKKSNYEIEIKKGAMKLFEEKVLFSGMCDSHEIYGCRRIKKDNI